MTERIVAPRLADIIEAIERIRRVLDGVTLEASQLEAGVIQPRRSTLVVVRHTLEAAGVDSSRTSVAAWVCDFGR